MSASASTLTRPLPKTERTSGRVYDNSAGMCAIEVVPEPVWLSIWRARLRPLTVRFVETSDGYELTAHLGVRASYASIPLTTGLFMSDTPRDRILTFRCALRDLAVGEACAADASVSDGVRTWAADVSVRIVEWDDRHVVASVRGCLGRTATMPLPSMPIRIDAALDLVRCD